MLSIAALFAIGTYQGTPPVKPAPETVLATVGGEPITAAEVEPYLWAWKSRDVVNELAGHRMVAAEAARKGIKVTDAEVQKRIDDQIANIKANLPAGQTYETVLNGQIGGLSRLGLIARSSLLVDKLAESEFKPEGFVKVATLLFRTTGDTTDALAKAIKSADAAYAALQGGKPWDAVLRVYEKEPRVLETGGLVGWKGLEAFPESVRTQLATIKPMGYTKPTQTSNGIQIFRLIARGAESSPTELAELKSLYVTGARRGIVDRLRQANKVEFK